MKKVSVFFSVLVCILLLLCGAAYASEFEFSEGVITGYNGSDERVVIPSSVDGKPVVAIGKDAFSYPLCYSYVGDDIIFETEKEYTRVKIMAWGGFTDLSPCAVAEWVE